MGNLDWLPRDNEIKNHELFGDEYFGTEPPSVIYELKPVKDADGNPVEGLTTAWITLNNPKQYNSYTTDMVKGVIAGFGRASADRSVVLVVFTAVGDKAFCTGGNTKEYAEYYSGRPTEYGAYMDLFNGMVDAILMCKKPVICRVNGMRVAGGQEIGMACDLDAFIRPGDVRPGRPATWLGAGRRLHRLSTLDACPSRRRSTTAYLASCGRPTRCNGWD